MSEAAAHTITITLQLNGAPAAATVGTDTLLIDLLRDHFRLTGTKEGCGVGVCGLCTVLLDEAPVSACILPAVLADGRAVWTIEGLSRRAAAADAAAADRRLLALQQSFIAHEGLQCGICTSGQLVSAYALLRDNPQPTDQEVRDWMSGNLCRCTGYHSIQRAIRAALSEEVAADDAGL